MDPSPRWSEPHPLYASRSAGCLLLAAGMLVLAAIPGCRRPVSEQRAASDGGTASAAVRIVYPAAPGSLVKLAATAARSVVHIRTDLPVRDGPADWFPASSLPPSPGTEEWTTRVQRALGSGFVVDRLGHVVTNAHIVGDQPERKLWVQLADGTELAAKIVGRDDRTDLAVLKVTPSPGTSLHPARIGRSKQLEVGEWVVALGNPFGLGHRVSVGVVSATPRHEGPVAQRGYWGHVQTDAAIDAGNSGGPLLNAVGEVVGVNTAIKEDSGVGFALPIDHVTHLLPLLKRDGKVVRGWVGMYIDRVTAQVAERLKLDEPHGALITGVVSGGPADQAGLRQGDVVLSLGNHQITDAAELPWISSAAGIGQVLQVTVWRGGKRLTFALRTQPMPE